MNKCQLCWSDEYKLLVIHKRNLKFKRISLNGNCKKINVGECCMKITN